MGRLVVQALQRLAGEIRPAVDAASSMLFAGSGPREPKAASLTHLGGALRVQVNPQPPLA